MRCGVLLHLVHIRLRPSLAIARELNLVFGGKIKRKVSPMTQWWWLGPILLIVGQLFPARIVVPFFCQGSKKVVAAGDTAKEETEDIGKAIKEILKISIPQIIQLVTGLLMGIFNTAVIGHIGTERQMAGAGMALMILQVGCFGIIIGLNSALNTLIS